MNNRSILQVRIGAHRDAIYVAAEHGPVPDAGPGAERHVAQHDGAGRDECRAIDVDYCLRAMTRSCVQAMTGSPFF